MIRLGQTPPLSPGGTTTENGVETVTVTASRIEGPPWLAIGILALAGYLLYERIREGRT